MAGYTKNREHNYEIKYLRKVLGEVDKRIQIPENISADSLRRLLDDVEAPVIRVAPARRPLKLSLQSGIAYAAAFALIVALFYSTRLYNPDMISGGMNIAEPERQTQDTLLLTEDEDDAGDDGIMGIAAQTPVTEMPESGDDPTPEPAALDAPPPESAPLDNTKIDQHSLGVGGSGKANLVLEREEYAVYWRSNDESDPDSSSPVSFEVVDTASQEIVKQTDVPLLSVEQSFDLNDGLIFVGNAESGAAICSYDISLPGEPLEQNVFALEGELVDARIYMDIVRVVTLADTADSEDDTELLPGAVSDETCVISAFDPKTQSFVTKKFTGANGTVQVHNLNAYIRYMGEDENGESRDYIAQIVFDGMDISLGTVS